MVVGLASGLFYRIYAQQIMEFTGKTELSVLHTHVLVLGMIFFLVALCIEKLFTISSSKWFNLFFWHYNSGLVLTAGMLLVIGIIQIDGGESNGMTAGIAGLGHILLTAGLGFFFAALSNKVKQ